MDRCYESHMGSGCPKCREIYLNRVRGETWGICLDFQLEQADADVLKAMNRVEDIKQKIRLKEKQNGLPSGKTS